MRIRDWINKGVVIGLLASIFLCVIGSAAGAFLMDREYLATDSEGIWMSVIWLQAAFFGCRIALRGVQGQLLLHGTVQATVLYFLVWCVALAVNAVPIFRVNGWYFTGCIFGGSILASVIPAGKRRRKKRAGAKTKRHKKDRQ